MPRGIVAAERSAPRCHREGLPQPSNGASGASGAAQVARRASRGTAHLYYRSMGTMASGALALPLDDAGVGSRHFGMKAAVLSRLSRAGLSVPSGWCVCLHYHPAGDAVVENQLSDIWNRIKPGPLVVRSSASLEDLPFALFAGRFESKANVRSLTAFISAVSAVQDSKESVAVRDYLEAFGIPQESIRMSVLVQQQIKAKYSGVTFTECPPGFPDHEMLTELTQGPSADILQGSRLGASYGLRIDHTEFGEQLVHEHVAGTVYETEEMSVLLPAMYAACVQVASELGAAQDIEWIWDGEKIWVVQARELADHPQRGDGFSLGQGNEYADTSSPVLKSLKNSERWGMKGAAEQYFEEIGRGASNSLLILPGVDESGVSDQLKVRRPGSHGTVIRFSHKAQVGLPKRFVPVDEDLVSAYLKLRADHSEWMGIVSDYIFIASSFEAYVTDRTLIVEHVPGNWEPDNRLTPDLFKFTSSGSEIYLFKGERAAKVEAPGSGRLPQLVTQRVPPLQFPAAKALARTVLTDFHRVRADFRVDLPINVHFIADREGRFYFLNIRPTANLEIVNMGRIGEGAAFKRNRFFTIAGPEDIDGWDGKSRVLVDFVADRGNESRIATLAVAMRNAGITKVYCTFGLLSHPAIVLREFKLAVEPLYIEHSVEKVDLIW